MSQNKKLRLQQTKSSHCTFTFAFIFKMIIQNDSIYDKQKSSEKKNKAKNNKTIKHKQIKQIVKQMIKKTAHNTTTESDQNSTLTKPDYL